MPDFNFAKGNSKRNAGEGSSAPRQHRAGPQQSAAGQASSTPQDPAAEAASVTPHASAGGQGKRPSILDKYPQHDLSHLTGETPPPPAEEDIPPIESNIVPETVETDAASGTGEAPAEAAADDAPAKPAAKSASSSTWPLIALLGVVLFLIAIAFIWHVNPWPPLKDSISGLFMSETSIEQVLPAADSETTEGIMAEDAAPMRSWDYFIQVSSWPDLAKADLDAERFRAQEFDVIVESEFIPEKGGTYYRVRLGPYTTSDEAKDLLATRASSLPSGAFLDSTRLIEDEIVESVPEEEGELPRSVSPPKKAGPVSAKLVTEPMNGWAVKVSSFKREDIARNEARRLLEQGYPSFITKKRIGSRIWYRVLVGPFSDKHDANRYMQLLNVTYGNEAYTVDLASY